MSLLLAALVALLAFFVQGFTGFGAALILAPLLLIFLDLHTAIVASALVQVPVGMVLAYQARHAIDRGAIRRLLPYSLIGLAAGAAALASLNVDWLRQLCGVLTALFALDVLRRAWRNITPRPWPGWAVAPAGLASGLLGGLFGTSGPPVIAYLESLMPRGAGLRATLIAYFLVINCLRIVGYGAGSLLTGAAGLTAAAMLPTAALGAWAGAALQRRAGERGFRLAVAAVLLLTGLALAL
jgi:uncharacterized membrane protein YfcA